MKKTPHNPVTGQPKLAVKLVLIGLLASLVAGCTLSRDSQNTTTRDSSENSVQEEANRSLTLAFYRPGISIAERDAMIHPDYQQHNPAAVRFAEQQGISAKEAFPLWMEIVTGGDESGSEPQAHQPPAGKQAYMTVAEDDKVFVMHQRFAQDPNEAPGTYYEYFSWGMFGFKDGLIYEHWDGNTISLDR